MKRCFLTQEEREFVVRAAAIITSLRDMEDEDKKRGGAYPASSFYLALGNDISAYKKVVRGCEILGWVKADAQTVSLTPKGRSKAEAIKEKTGI